MAKQKKQRTTWLLALLGCGMFAFSFAMVPLYDVLCDITGLNGKTGGRVEIAEVLEPDLDRTVTVEFIASVNQSMPWEFAPVVSRMEVHPGKMYRTSFHAKNRTDRTMVGQAIPSVTPWQATEHFNKTECFCFQQQPLDAGEGKEMELQFVIGSDLPEKYSTVTLSYTFMDTANGVIEAPKGPHEQMSVNVSRAY